MEGGGERKREREGKSEKETRIVSMCSQFDWLCRLWPDQHS